MGTARTHLVLGAMASLVVGGNVLAEEITVPYPFSPGNTIRSSEMNQNFQTVYDKVNEISSMAYVPNLSYLADNFCEGDGSLFKQGSFDINISKNDKNVPINIFCESERQIAWIKIGSNVCFGAKDNSNGAFVTDFTGYITQIMLTHLNGQVSCWSSSFANWGCSDHGASQMGVQMRTVDGNLVFPDINNDSHVSAIDGNGTPTETITSWYAMDNYNHNSSRVVYEKGISFFKGGTYNLWYGEDWSNSTEHDNSGKTCANVYVR